MSERRKLIIADKSDDKASAIEIFAKFQGMETLARFDKLSELREFIDVDAPKNVIYALAHRLKDTKIDDDTISEIRELDETALIMGISTDRYFERADVNLFITRDGNTTQFATQFAAILELE